MYLKVRPVAGGGGSRDDGRSWAGQANTFLNLPHLRCLVDGHACGGNEQGSDFRMSVPVSPVQRDHAALVERVHISASYDEQFGRSRAAFSCRPVQRRHPVIVLCADSGAVADEQDGGVYMTTARSPVQRGSAVVVLPVNIGPGCKKVTDGIAVALFGCLENELNELSRFFVA